MLTLAQLGLALHRGFKSYWCFCSCAHSHDIHRTSLQVKMLLSERRKMSKEVTNTTGRYKKKKEKQRQVLG